MKIQIKNFGPIKSFDFDLKKDLHVIYGKNNIGKSYATSLIYILFKNMMELKMVKVFDFSVDSYETLRRKTKQRVDGNSFVNIDMASEFPDILQSGLESHFLPKFQVSFNNTFGGTSYAQNRLIKDSFSIRIELEPYVVFDIQLDKNNNLSIRKLIFGEDFKIKMIEENVYKHIKKITAISPRKVRNNDIFIKLMLNGIMQELIIEPLKNISEIFFLPASRSGLYMGMSGMSSIFAKLSQMRFAIINEKIEIPSLPEPVSDYFLELANITNQTNNANDVYSQLAEEIESEILGATIVVNSDNKKLEYYNQKTDLRLDLSATSSMVSEMAPIVAYLKYIVHQQKKEEGAFKVIFIEEPEAHLHPEIQIKLLKIFAKLTENNIKVVMTTHSNYIFNKVNNLILGEQIDPAKIANYHVVGTPEGSVVEGGTEVSEEGIEDNNFVNVAEDLYRERLELLNDDD